MPPSVAQFGGLADGDPVGAMPPMSETSTARFMPLDLAPPEPPPGWFRERLDPGTRANVADPPAAKEPVPPSPAPVTSVSATQGKPKPRESELARDSGLSFGSTSPSEPRNDLRAPLSLQNVTVPGASTSQDPRRHAPSPLVVSEDPHGRGKTAERAAVPAATQTTTPTMGPKRSVPPARTPAAEPLTDAASSTPREPPPAAHEVKPSVGDPPSVDRGGTTPPDVVDAGGPMPATALVIAPAAPTVLATSAPSLPDADPVVQRVELLLAAFGRALEAVEVRQTREILHVALTAQQEHLALVMQSLADQRHEYGDQLERAVRRLSDELSSDSVTEIGELFRLSAGEITGALRRTERLSGTLIEKQDQILGALGTLARKQEQATDATAKLLAVACELRDLGSVLAGSLAPAPGRAPTSRESERRLQVVARRPDLLEGLADDESDLDA